jgi:hypothetical protein
LSWHGVGTLIAFTLRAISQKTANQDLVFRPFGFGPFDPAWVGTYPTFKNPAQDFETGTSLCKYGFPFHDLIPTWNEATDGFDVADDQFPLPFFLLRASIRTK